jgi:hypothetical protein
MTPTPGRAASPAGPGLAASPAGGSALPSQPPAGPELSPGIARAAALMSEDDVEAGMRRILKDLGLRLAYHPWKLHAKRAREGFPDWTIAGPGGLIFRELKKQAGDPSPAQQRWLDALAAAGTDARVWRPSDLLSGRIARELAALAGMRPT